MSFKQSLRSMMESQAKEVLRLMELSTPDYQPREEVKRDASRTDISIDSDLNVFGKLLVKSGALVAVTGISIELLPETADTASHMVLASGIGAAAIGAAVIGYEKVS